MYSTFQLNEEEEHELENVHKIIYMPENNDPPYTLESIFEFQKTVKSRLRSVNLGEGRKGIVLNSSPRIESSYTKVTADGNRVNIHLPKYFRYDDALTTAMISSTVRIYRRYVGDITDQYRANLIGKTLKYIQNVEGVTPNIKEQSGIKKNLTFKCYS